MSAVAEDRASLCLTNFMCATVQSALSGASFLEFCVMCGSLNLVRL